MAMTALSHYSWNRECLNDTTLCDHQRALWPITEVEIEKLKCKRILVYKKSEMINLYNSKCICSWTLVLPGLQALDARQHVQMACWILLNHIHYIIRPQALFKPPLRHQETHDTESKTSTPSQLIQQYWQSDFIKCAIIKKEKQLILNSFYLKASAYILTWLGYNHAEKCSCALAKINKCINENDRFTIPSKILEWQRQLLCCTLKTLGFEIKLWKYEPLDHSLSCHFLMLPHRGVVQLKTDLTIVRWVKLLEQINLSKFTLCIVA